MCSTQDCYCECWEEGTAVLGVTSASLSQESVAVFLLLSFASLFLKCQEAGDHMEVKEWGRITLTLGQLSCRCMLGA